MVRNSANRNFEIANLVCLERDSVHVNSNACSPGSVARPGLRPIETSKAWSVYVRNTSKPVRLIGDLPLARRHLGFGGLAGVGVGLLGGVAGIHLLVICFEQRL